MAHSARVARDLSVTRAWLRALEAPDADEATRFGAVVDVLDVLVQLEGHRRKATDALRPHATAYASIDRALRQADDLRTEWHSAVLSALRRYVSEHGCPPER